MGACGLRSDIHPPPSGCLHMTYMQSVTYVRVDKIPAVKK